MRLHPLGVFINHRLERGLEVELEPSGTHLRVVAIRESSQRPQPFILSPAFVNAHSHLEYRGLLGQIKGLPYWGWLRKLTELKSAQSLDEVKADCQRAAKENRETGVALIAEHSDRPFSAMALAEQGIGGRIHQELITFFEQSDASLKWMVVESKCTQQSKSAFLGEVSISPHAPWTVDAESLKKFKDRSGFSIHVAESPFESQFYEKGEGPIADLYRSSGMAIRPTGKRVVSYLDDLGLCHSGAQFVHACDVQGTEIGLLAEREVAIAHCPRSNLALDCPLAPIRRLWDAGCLIGLGLDSAASSGPIDFFAEMRAAMVVALRRGEALTPEMIWSMATTTGAESIGYKAWDIREGNGLPLLAIRAEEADLERVIHLGVPEDVQWLSPNQVMGS